MPNLKLGIIPDFNHVEKGEGGIRRVVEAQKKYLPAFGIEIISGSLEERMEHSDILAYHGGIYEPTNKPTVSHCHGLYWKDHEWQKWAHDINIKVVEAMRQSTVVTSPSKWVSRALRRGMWLNSPVLYHGIDTSEWTPPDAPHASERYVLWNKNRVDAICENDTLAKLSQMSPDTSFVTTFGHRDTGNNVTIIGRMSVDKMREYVQNASVYLCNTRETFGIGTLEAMACGVPILGWNWGGQKEIITHRVDGWLSRPGDYDDLLTGLKYCMENRVAMGESARKKVMEKFTWPAVMKDYAELYHETLDRWRIAQSGPRVSVIITCYNLADTLPRAVASITEQEGSGQDHEIIIVNDASPDNTASVAADLAANNPKISVVTNPTNLYLAGSLNAGIAASKGRYIIPLDADNILAPNSLSILGDALDKPTADWNGDGANDGYRLDIVYGAMGVIEQDGSKFISDWPPRVFDYASQMSHRNQITSTAMYRREVWSRVGGYRRRCRTAEDADFWCRATSFGAVPRRVTDAPLLIYYNRPDSMSHVEKDWPWHAWYPNWNKKIPMGAPVDRSLAANQLEVSTYEPARVTVIIPVGPQPGHADLVIDAIDSLVAQSFERWDCIVVNDSGRHIPWLHPFVTVLTTGSKGGRGPAVSRNIGIKASRTPLFMLLDADDYLQPNALEIMLSAWRPGNYVYSDWIVQETGEIYRAPDYDCNLLVQKQLHAITILCERESWSKVGGFDTKVDLWEDWDFLLSLASIGICGIRAPAALFQYRLHGGERREKAYARKDELKTVFAEKWHKYIIDKEPLMACGGCGPRTTVPVTNPYVSANFNNSSIQSDSSDNGLVLLEYVGEGAARSYRGADGMVYRFGADSSHKVKYVQKKDADFLLARDEFKLVDKHSGSDNSDSSVLLIDEKPALEAAGPPKR